MRKSVRQFVLVALMAVFAPAALAAAADPGLRDLGIPAGSWEHRLHDFAAQNPGFAGISFDAEGRATILVTDVERPAPGIANLLRATAGARLAPARYDFQTLSRFKRQARPLLDLEGAATSTSTRAATASGSASTAATPSSPGSTWRAAWRPTGCRPTPSRSSRWSRSAR